MVKNWKGENSKNRTKLIHSRFIKSRGSMFEGSTAVVVRSIHIIYLNKPPQRNYMLRYSNRFLLILMRIRLCPPHVQQGRTATAVNGRYCRPVTEGPYECEECGTDFTPSWKAIGTSSSDMHLYCEQCVRAAQKRKIRTDHSNVLKKAYNKINSQEKVCYLILFI